MYIIRDWNNKICFKGKTFNSFDDAWGFLYNQFDHLEGQEFDDEMSEYWVTEE